MSYHPYIFRIPAGTPELTFDGLSAWMGDRGTRRIGTTVTITFEPDMGVYPTVFWFKLYDLELAGIFRHCVEFTSHDDPHAATTAWISLIVRDNAIGMNVWRIPRRKADGPGVPVPRGTAGLLCIGGDRGTPVFGHLYTVTPRRIEAQRQQDRELRERIRQANSELAAQTRLGNLAWEAGRLRRQVNGDSQAAQELAEVGMGRTDADARTRLAELERELAEATAHG